jgi:hypothetical protein
MSDQRRFAMNYFETMDWKKIKKDVEHGLEKGMVAVKKGALVVKKKTGELTDEGKRQYKIMTLKSKVHSQMTDLGARVYSLIGTRSKNPALDATVKDIVAQVKKNEVLISALTKKSAVETKKKKA